MRIVQAKRPAGENWIKNREFESLQNPLVFVFGDRKLLESDDFYQETIAAFPTRHIVFGSSAGEIYQQDILDNSAVMTAIDFETSSFEVRTANCCEFQQDSDELGKALVANLPQENLRHIFVISEGSFVNGSKLVKGMESNLDQESSVTGGMCGDNDRFEKTLVSYNEKPKEGEVIAIGFYGESLDISYASSGGWIPFGPERVITKAEGNILYEIDGMPALDLYSKYLGEKSKELPGASLFYPLNIRVNDQTEPVTRTVLNIDKENNSMILAGNAPVNSKVQLMMASVDSLVEGASKAAKKAMKNRKNKPSLALVVSCIGRKLVMDQRAEEELEEVAEIIGQDSFLFGFYSYGEMAPFETNRFCELHNQTMTLTLISES